MTHCDLDTTVPDWIIEHPETLAVFRALGIDEGCGGKSLAYACRERGLDARFVLGQLQRCVKPEGHPTSTTGRDDGHPSCEPRGSH